MLTPANAICRPGGPGPDMDRRWAGVPRVFAQIPAGACVGAARTAVAGPAEAREAAGLGVHGH